MNHSDQTSINPGRNTFRPGQKDPGQKQPAMGSSPHDETPRSDFSEAAAAKTDVTPEGDSFTGRILAHNYEVGPQIGAGGMGTVYRGRNLNSGQAVAIKVMRLSDSAGSVDSLEMDLFIREAQVLERINHPAVVRYFGLLKDADGTAFIPMSFIDGPSLTKLLRNGPLPTDAVIRLGLRLAEGLAAVHEQGVLHRDLSPDNVILPNGEVDQATLIDFGIARMERREEEGASDVSLIGARFAGKFAYASPEQLGIEEYLGPASDLYSLGLILAEAARGEALPMGDDPRTAVRARLSPIDLSGIDEVLRRVVERLLAVKSIDRYASAEVLSEALRALRLANPASAAAPSPSTTATPQPGGTSARPPKSSVGWSPARVFGGAAVVVLVSGALGYFLLTPFKKITKESEYSVNNLAQPKPTPEPPTPLDPKPELPTPPDPKPDDIKKYDPHIPPDAPTLGVAVVMPPRPSRPATVPTTPAERLAASLADVLVAQPCAAVRADVTGDGQVTLLGVTTGTLRSTTLALRLGTVSGVTGVDASGVEPITGPFCDVVREIPDRLLAARPPSGAFAARFDAKESSLGREAGLTLDLGRNPAEAVAVVALRSDGQAVPIRTLSLVGQGAGGHVPLTLSEVAMSVSGPVIVLAIAGPPGVAELTEVGRASFAVFAERLKALRERYPELSGALATATVK